MNAPRPNPSILTMSRRGFTILEAVLSLSAFAILVTGIGSVFVLASRALPTTGGANETTIGATAAMDQLTTDLRSALSVSEATATAVTFVVPDRTGDATPETIRYAWAGSGSPLTRQVNGGTVATLLASVSNLSIAYAKRTIPSTQTSSVSTDSGEVLLCSFTGWASVGSPTTNMQGLNSTTYASEAFTVDKVTIPSDTTKWYITRVSARVAHPLLSTAAVSVAVCLPSGVGSPVAGTQVGTAGVIGSGLLSIGASWQDASYTDVNFTDPTIKNLVLLFKSVGGNSQVEYISSASAPTDAYTFLWTTTSGGTWLPATNRQQNDTKFYVYGGYIHPVQVQVAASTYALGSVNITLQPTADAATRIDAGFSLMNQPSVPGP